MDYLHEPLIIKDKQRIINYINSTLDRIQQSEDKNEIIYLVGAISEHISMIAYNRFLELDSKDMEEYYDGRN